MERYAQILVMIAVIILAAFWKKIFRFGQKTSEIDLAWIVSHEPEFSRLKIKSMIRGIRKAAVLHVPCTQTDKNYSLHRDKINIVAAEENFIR